MANYGGVITFKFEGNLLRTRAKMDIEPGDFTYTAEHNQDGSYDRMAQVQGPAIDTEFVASPDGDNPAYYDWNAIVAGGPYNISVTETSNGRSHTISQGSFVGRAKIDVLKGLVTGLSICGRAGSYKPLSI